MRRNGKNLALHKYLTPCAFGLSREKFHSVRFFILVHDPIREIPLPVHVHVTPKYKIRDAVIPVPERHEPQLIHYFLTFLNQPNIAFGFVCVPTNFPPFSVLTG